MSESSLLFKLTFLLLAQASFATVKEYVDPCLSRPLEKPEKTPVLDNIFFKDIGLNFDQKLGLWKSEFQANVDIKNIYKTCFEQCYGVSLYSDSCTLFEFDKLGSKNIYKILNARLKDTPIDDFEKKFPNLNEIRKNLQKCLSPDFSGNFLAKLDPNQMTFRVSFLRLTSPLTDLAENAYIKNLSFTSTTIDFGSVEKYMKDGKHMLVFSQGVSELSQVPINGRHIQSCSLVPADKEFLLSSGQCWQVERIMDYKPEQNVYSMRCVASQKYLTQDQVAELQKLGQSVTYMTMDDLISKNCKKFGENGRILESLKRKGRILAQVTNPDIQGAEVQPNADSEPRGNQPPTFASKRIFLKPVDCKNVPNEASFAAII